MNTRRIMAIQGTNPLQGIVIAAQGATFFAVKHFAQLQDVLRLEGLDLFPGDKTVLAEQFHYLMSVVPDECYQPLYSAF